MKAITVFLRLNSIPCRYLSSNEYISLKIYATAFHVIEVLFNFTAAGIAYHTSYVYFEHDYRIS